MISLYFVLLLLSLVAFVVSAFLVNPPNQKLLAIGLALWVAVPFIQTLQKL